MDRIKGRGLQLGSHCCVQAVQMIQHVLPAPGTRTRAELDRRREAAGLNVLKNGRAAAAQEFDEVGDAKKSQV